MNQADLETTSVLKRGQDTQKDKTKQKQKRF